MTAKLFEAALGITTPWTVASVEFDETAKTLTVLIDFKSGSRFAVSGHEGVHPVHDTVTKSYRHLNFFQHECHLQVRTPRVKLPNGSVRLVEPDFAGRLNGFTLLFEADAICCSGAHRGRVAPPCTGGVPEIRGGSMRLGRLLGCDGAGH
jgi:transposase